MNYLAQKNIPLFPDPATHGSKLEGQGPLGLEGESVGRSAIIFANLLSSAIGILTVVAFIWFFVKLLIGAIQLISSGGDKAKVAEARGNIMTALIGVIVVISAVFIIRFVAELMGMPNVLNIYNMVETLAPK